MKLHCQAQSFYGEVPFETYHNNLISVIFYTFLLVITEYFLHVWTNLLKA